MNEWCSARIVEQRAHKIYMLECGATTCQRGQSLSISSARAHAVCAYAVNEARRRRRWQNDAHESENNHFSTRLYLTIRRERERERIKKKKFKSKFINCFDGNSTRSSIYKDLYMISITSINDICFIFSRINSNPSVFFS